MKKSIVIIIGLLFSVGGIQQIASASEYESNGKVTFEADDTITKPIDPSNPENSVIPIDSTDSNGPKAGTASALSIDFVSNFQFGTQKITTETKSYFAELQKFEGSEPGPNYVQVTDKRGTQTGWTLSVIQNEQFKTVENEILTGSVLSIMSGDLTSVTDMTYAPTAETSFDFVPGTEQEVVKAQAGKGMGTWVYRFGSDAKTGGTAVKLEVPGKTVKLAKAYQTTLTWNLKAVPGE